jgi:hypothetical protein
MATFTIQDDLTVRSHLATLAKGLRTRFSHSTYQGEYVNTVTGDTFGDRVQSGTTRKIGGITYLFVLNVLVARNAGGTVRVRISAWHLNELGHLVGSWPIVTKLDRVTLTANRGLVERVKGSYVHFDATRRIGNYLEDAVDVIKSGASGDPVKVEHTDKYGDNPYSTLESHLVPYGGADAVKALLYK